MSNVPAADFSFPNRILFGDGRRAALGDELTRLGINRPLVVTDPGVLAAGLIEQVGGPLLGAPRFDGVQTNPTEGDVLAGLARFRDEGCDGLVAVGGGSPIDAAKAIRLLAGHPGTLADYDLTTGGMARITAAMPSMVAIPTTAGTGSEAGRGALIQDPASGRKRIVLSPFLLPSAAICDPELCRDLPPFLTAATGMDAFTHAVESYLSMTFHPICDAIAVEALTWIRRGCEPSVQRPHDREARAAMMLGATLAGISFHKGLGIVHSLSHALGGVGRVHHGALNAVLLPHALRFNAEAVAPRIDRLAGQIGLESGQGGGTLIALAAELPGRLGLPRRLGEFPDLDRGKVAHYAELAMRDHCHRTNPRPCTSEDMTRLLGDAW